MTFIAPILLHFLSQTIQASNLPPSSVSQEPQSLDLLGAISYAIEHSPDLNTAQKEYSISDLNRSNAVAKLLPSLDLKAVHGWEGQSPRENSNPWASRLTLGLTETLYDNGQSLTALKVSKLKENQAQFNYQKERDRLALEVATEFYRYTIAKHTQLILQKQNALLDKQQKAVTSEYHQGLRTQKDYFRFQTQMSRSEIDLLQAELSVRKSQETMVRLLGVPLSQSTQFEFIIINSVNSVNSVNSANSANSPSSPSLAGSSVSHGGTGVSLEVPTQRPEIENHYEFKIAQLQRQINDLETDQAHKQQWPELFLTSGVQYGSKNYLGSGRSFTDNDGLSWNALITLQYNFWDFGIRRRASEIASHQNRIKQNQLDVQLLSTRMSINKLMLELAQLEKQYLLSKTLLQAERKSLSLLEAEYRNGKVPYLDFITGLKDFADAEIKLLTAYYQLKQSILQYQFHQGTLYEYFYPK